MTTPSSNIFAQIELYIEMEEEKKQLREQFGLSDIEIEGYFEFFAENYVQVQNQKGEN